MEAHAISEWAKRTSTSPLLSSIFATRFSYARQQHGTTAVVTLSFILIPSILQVTSPFALQSLLLSLPSPLSSFLRSGDVESHPFHRYLSGGCGGSVTWRHLSFKYSVYTQRVHSVCSCLGGPRDCVQGWNVPLVLRSSSIGTLVNITAFHVTSISLSLSTPGSLPRLPFYFDAPNFSMREAILIAALKKIRLYAAYKISLVKRDRPGAGGGESVKFLVHLSLTLSWTPPPFSQTTMSPSAWGSASLLVTTASIINIYIQPYSSCSRQ